LVPRTAFDDACRALARRRLTEAEVRQRLGRRYSATDIESAIQKLKEYRFLDDDALIADYVRERLRLAPRSRELLEAELEKRGIGSDDFRRVFEQEFSGYDELEVARSALKAQIKQLLKVPAQGRREKALRFLRSRGFSYEVMLDVWDRFRRQSPSDFSDVADE
jgi:regulatory protein